MAKKNIFIVSGAIQSGKTTSLINWAKSRSDVYGIFTPISEGKRVFRIADSAEVFPMEAGTEEKTPISVGKYKFSLSSFAKAVQVLNEHKDRESGWLVIDEIGPLELQGKGFDEIFREILNDEKSTLKLIIVVREKVVQDVLKRYQLQDHEIHFFDPKSSI